MNYERISLSKLAKRKGAGGLLAVLGVAVAVAVIVFPLARWHASLTNSAEGLKEGLENISLRLEMLSAMEDRWHQINDMDVAEFNALTSDKETQYGKFTVKESFGAVGKYNSSTGKCDDGTPGDGDRACRVATLTVTSEDGGSTLGPVQAIRVASSDDRLRNLEVRVATAQATANAANTNANNALSKFSSYYTKPEVDAKIEEGSGGGGEVTTAQLVAYTWGSAISPSKSYCSGSKSPTDYYMSTVNINGVYGSNMCSYLKNGYQLPSACFTRHYGTSDYDDAYMFRCNVVCSGKKCSAI